MTTSSCLSVGVPAYNQGPYLRETIESLLNQRVQPLEIVVSNNHSTDETAAVCREYANRVRVIMPPMHLSATDHFNFVMSQLQGSWVSLLSSDDLACPGYVDTFTRNITVTSNCVLVRAGIENIDNQGRHISESRLLSVPRICRPPQTLLHQLTSPKVSFAAFAIRKDAWEEAGRFPTEVEFIQDWCMWLRLALKGDFVRDSEIVSRYRCNYRPEVPRRRITQEFRDSAKLYQDILPGLIASLKGDYSRQLTQASRARFRTMIANASHLIKPEESTAREEIVQIAQAWAACAGCQNILLEFRGGAVFQDKPSVLGILKNALTGLYGKLRS